MRARALVMACLAVAALSGCGDDTTTVNAGPGGSDLSSVVDRFGRAYVSGDTAALMGMLEPRVVDGFDDQSRAALQALSRPAGSVELRDFASKIVRQDATSAEATYTGQRCAATDTNHFPSSTMSGNADTDTPTSMSSGGTAGTAAAACSDIAGVSSASPTRFVQVGGRWYGTLPGL